MRCKVIFSDPSLPFPLLNAPSKPNRSAHSGNVRWYALHVRSNFEHLVTDKLEFAGIEAYYPFKLARSRDDRRAVEKKFMPGYVFARFDLADKTPVIAIPQVVSIIGIGRHAVSIPESQIESVRLISSQDTVQPCEFITAGARVRVTRGLCEGLEGFVVKVKGTTRVVVSIVTIARSMSVEVDSDSLELVTDKQLPLAA